MQVKLLLKKFRKVFLILLSVLLVFFLSVGLLVSLKRDAIESFLVSELNKQLTGKVEVGKLTFSVFRSFPRASLILDRVMVFSDKTGKEQAGDTVLQADKLQLQFHLIQLLRKEYVLRRLVIDNGKLWIQTDTDGLTHFRVWKSPAGDSNGRLNLDLQDVRLRNVGVEYIHKPAQIRVGGYTRRTVLKGTFRGNDLSLQADADILLYLLQVKKFSAAREIPVLGNLELTRKDSLWNLTASSLRISGLDLQLQGEILTGVTKRTDLLVKGTGLSIRSLSEMVLPALAEKWQIKRSTGAVDIEGHLSQLPGGEPAPHVDLDFRIRGAELAMKNSSVHITGFSGMGTLHNGVKNSLETTELEVQSFTAAVGASRISGSFHVRDFVRPVISGQGTVDGSVEEILKVFSSGKRPDISGRIRANLAFHFQPENLREITREDLIKSELRGNLTLSGMQFRLGKSAHQIANLSGDLMFSGSGPVWFDNLQMEWNQVPLVLDGKAENLLSFVLGGREMLHLEGRVSSPEIDLKAWLNVPAGRQEDRMKRFWPEHISMDLEFTAGILHIKPFTATQVEGMLIYEPGLMIIPRVSFLSMQGKLNGNGMLMKSVGDSMLFNTQVAVDNVNMHELFASFRNFGQDFISAEHLNGNLKGNISMKMVFSPEWEINKESLLAEAQITIDNGELIHFEPMEKLSRFVDLKELEHVKFSRLENTIYIREQRVIIPHMDIHSNAFNISATGEHGLDKYFQYRLRILLSEILARKARRPEPQETEFGWVEEDGLNQTSLYLQIEGTPDDYRVSYDRAAVRDVIRQSIREQGREVREILRDEFGWFRDDTLTPGDTVSKTFRIRWEEETGSETETEADSLKGTGASSKPAFRIIWEEEEDTLDTKRKTNEPHSW